MDSWDGWSRDFSPAVAQRVSAARHRPGLLHPARSRPDRAGVGVFKRPTAARLPTAHVPGCNLPRLPPSEASPRRPPASPARSRVQRGFPHPGALSAAWLPRKEPRLPTYPCFLWVFQHQTRVIGFGILRIRMRRQIAAGRLPNRLPEVLETKNPAGKGQPGFLGIRSLLGTAIPANRIASRAEDRQRHHGNLAWLWNRNDVPRAPDGEAIRAEIRVLVTG
jgi:hypothetical protein